MIRILMAGSTEITQLLAMEGHYAAHMWPSAHEDKRGIMQQCSQGERTRLSSVGPDSPPSQTINQNVLQKQKSNRVELPSGTSLSGA